jgi:hypothetical protein
VKLAGLEAEFLRYERRGDGHTYLHHVETIGEAQGVMLLCPKCFEANGGPRGTHHVICWSSSRGVPDFAEPKPGRWKMVGAGLHDLTLEAEQPGGARSVLLTGEGCGWHGFITNGEAT